MVAPYNPGDLELPASITETLATKYGVNLNGSTTYARADYGNMSIHYVAKGNEQYVLLITWDMTPESPTRLGCCLNKVGLWKDGKWVTVPALSDGAKTEKHSGS
jgi:hypothetical protein